MANAIMVIYPYKQGGLWMIDDEKTGLYKEPLIEGTDRMIDRVLAIKALKSPEAGFKLIFSSEEFPRYDIKCDWVREGEGGNWYRSEELQMEGWLCPALLRYFDKAPNHIYARFEEMTT